jgi:hypothetical protein
MMKVGIAIAAVLGVLLISRAAAADVMELRSARVDYIHFFDGGHDPLITQNGQENRALGIQLDLHVDVDVLRYFFWNSTVHSVTDKRIYTGDAAGQFREVNLQMQFGLRVFPVLDVYYWHSSAHMLDNIYTGGHWPVQDGIGATLTIYQAPSGAKHSLIGGN